MHFLNRKFLCNFLSWYLVHSHVFSSLIWDLCVYLDALGSGRGITFYMRVTFLLKERYFESNENGASFLFTLLHWFDCFLFPVFFWEFFQSLLFSVGAKEELKEGKWPKSYCRTKEPDFLDCKWLPYWEKMSGQLGRLTFYTPISLFLRVLVHFIHFFSMSCQDKQLKTGSVKQIDSKILAEHKKKERVAAKQGKEPFYLKKCNIFISLPLPYPKVLSYGLNLGYFWKEYCF